MDDPPQRTSQRIRMARARTRPQGLSAMVLAFTVLFVLAYVFVIRTPPEPPKPDMRSVSGTYAWQRATGDPTTHSGEGAFAAAEGGDASGTLRSVDAAAAVVTSAYDAGQRSERTTVGGERTGGATTTVTVGAWPPVWRLQTPSPLDLQGLSAIVRAAVEDGDTSVGVKPLEQDGRKVWRAALKLDGTTQELVVDQASGLVTWWTDGASTLAALVDWTAAQREPSPDGSPSGTADEEVTVDGTYAYERSLAAAGRTAGFDPLVSSLAPDGYLPVAIATAAAGDAPVSWAPPSAGSADEARQVVQLYTRGLAWFEVRQVASTASPDGLARALETARSTALSFEQTPLQYGAFAGRTASSWYAATGPTLVVGDGRRAVYVTGALTRRELLSLAEGFKPLTAGTTASPASPPAP